MGDQPVERRLAAILAADVAGYTRRMEEDTDGTVAAWQAARQTVIRPQIEAHSGTIVKLTGDGFLAEFATIQAAVNCAIAMQAGLEDSPLDFRMGINLGDIVHDGEDIHGEGVNVAARLEGLAEPGGICISGGVYDQVRNRIVATYEDMGEREVKNVSSPVRAYKVVTRAGTAGAELEGNLAAAPAPRPAAGAGSGIAAAKRRRGLGVAAAAAVVLAVGGGSWFYLQGAQPSFDNTALHGVSPITGESFVMTLEAGGRALLEIGNDARKRHDEGKWWISETGRFCFQFTRFFGRREQRCRLVEQRDDTRLARTPNNVGEPWVFKPL